MSGVEVLPVEPGEDGLRLDRWFRARFPRLPQSRLQKLVRTGQVRVDGARAETSTRLAAGALVRVPPLQEAEVAAGEDPNPRPASASSEDARFLRSILLHEDRDVLVFNKPLGLAVQGGSGLTRHVDGMLASLASQKGEVPRLVHRIDRDTSGVLVVARTRKAAADLTAAFRHREARKVYWALVRGVPRVKRGRVSTYLVKGKDEKGDDRMRVAAHGDRGADHALTYYAVVETAAQKLAWVSMKPVTGRTHQLRAHAAHMGHPIIGDPKYFVVENWELPGGIQNRLHLLARRIVLPLPSGGVLDVSAPLPPHMRQSWNLLGLDADARDPIEDAPD